jgi:GT2 family glycosyltransferase
LKTAFTALVPVYNAQNDLEHQVHELLEVLPELCHRFRLVLADDQSADESIELGYELAFRYPQVEFIRNPLRQGLAKTIQAGLARSEAELIIVSPRLYRFDPDDLRNLWRLRENDGRLARSARSGLAREPADCERIRRWTLQSGLDRHGFQVLLRAAWEQYNLEESLETSRRLDRVNSACGPLRASRPNYLDKTSPLVRGR